MKKIYRRKNIYLIVFLTLILFMSTCATAFGTEEKGCTISVNFKAEGQSTDGAYFKVYKIGTIESDGSIALEEAYKDYPMVWDIGTAEQLKDICTTLLGYIDRDNIAPTAEGATNGEGEAEIKVEDAGIYMVVGSLYKTEEAVYSVLPSLIQINEEDTYKEICIKYEKTIKQREDMTVMKIWTGEKDQLFRPKKIEAELYKDGELYDTVELSDENGWKHTWSELSTESIWTVTEKTVLEEYRVTVSKEETVFFIKNDFDKGLHGGDDKRDDPENTTPNRPTNEIPYTGTLWWPVLVMSMVGMMFLSAGVLVKRGR